MKRAPQRTRGMERREAHLVFVSLPASRAKRCEVRKRIALRRSIAAILGEGTVLPGADGGGYSTPDPDGFRRLRPLRVQPANGRAT